MEILQLEYFCSAAELENFTLAAKKHYIPQSAMSITIKRLENEVGKELFDRVGNRIQLNDAGKQFYTHAKNCLTELQNAKECVQAFDEPSGEIRLLVQEERHAIADLVVAFRKKYPLIRFYICHNQTEQPLSSFHMIVTSNIVNHDAIVAPIIEEQFMLAVAKSHRFATRDSVHIDELKNEDFVMFPQGHSSNNLVMNACQKSGFLPKASILCDEPICMRKYISADLGIAIVPISSWQGIDNCIELVPLVGCELSRRTMLECSKNSLSIVAVKLFYDFCIENCGHIQNNLLSMP